MEFNKVFIAHIPLQGDG